MKNKLTTRSWLSATGGLSTVVAATSAWIAAFQGGPWWVYTIAVSASFAALNNVIGSLTYIVHDLAPTVFNSTPQLWEVTLTGSEPPPRPTEGTEE